MNNRVRTEVGHRVLPHTADVIVEEWAPSRSGCLEELVRGVVETFAATRNATATREVPLEVGAASWRGLASSVRPTACSSGPRRPASPALPLRNVIVSDTVPSALEIDIPVAVVGIHGVLADAIAALHRGELDINPVKVSRTAANHARAQT